MKSVPVISLTPRLSDSRPRAKLKIVCRRKLEYNWQLRHSYYNPQAFLAALHNRARHDVSRVTLLPNLADATARGLPTRSRESGSAAAGGAG